MFDFNGSIVSGGRVDLGGTGNRSRARGSAEESRSEFVKRQHREREARERQRVRQRAATQIQAVFRGYHAVKAKSAVFRQSFDKRQADIAKVSAILPEDKKAKFIFHALMPMLRLFTFFFTRVQDGERLTSMLDLVFFSAGQQPACNIFHILLEEQSLSFLVLFQKLVTATLSAGRVALVAQLLLSMQAALYSGAPGYAPVDSEKSAAAVVHVLLRTQVLAALTRGFLLEAPQAPHALEQPPGPEGGRLVWLFAAGLSRLAACSHPGRGELLGLLLSTPRLGDFLCEVPLSLQSACLRRLADVVAVCDPPPASCPFWKEDVDAEPRLGWLVGNIVTVLERLLLPAAGDVTVLPPWLHWISRAKEHPCSRSSRQLDRLHRASFVRALLHSLNRQDHEGLLAVCQLFFSPLGHVADCEPPAEVLQTLAFATPLAEKLFPSVLDLMRNRSAAGVFEVLGPPALASAEATRLRVFCMVYGLQLQPMYDYEFFGPANPLRTDQVELLTPLLNRLAYHMVTNLPAASLLSVTAKAVRSSLTSLVKILYNRHRRRPILASDDVWIIPESRLLLRKAPVIDLGDDAERDAQAEADTMDVDEIERASSGTRQASSAIGDWPHPSVPSRTQLAETMVQPGAEQALEAVLEEIPHVIPFQDRVALLHNVITADQDKRRDTRGPWAQAAMQRHQIRRNFLVEDGFAAFEALNDEGQLRDVFRVEFIAPDGVPESGVDGGGLFKEFMVHICRTMFDPEFGLFSATSDQTLFPALSAFRVHDKVTLDLYTFLGKVVGKAIYEMFLLEPQFSRVFLNRLLGRVNEVDDVAALDKELHRNMLVIKECEHVEDLGLTFSISISDLGHIEEIDLVPNGRNVPVTKENLTKYFHLMANYKTNVQFHRQTAAFLRGLQCVVPLAWLKMFDPYELNMLVSGSTAGFDVQDLRQNTVYSGGYQDDSPVVVWLWRLLSEQMGSEDMGRFLMFATSCSRAPLLGFKNLFPKFCIHRVPDSERLPTASTCANLLKLPDYTSFEVLKTKLMQAIYAEAGFDLS